MRRTTSRPVICSAPFRERNAVSSTSSTSAFEIYCPMVSSRIASVYSIIVRASSSMAAIAGFTAGSMRGTVGLAVFPA